MARKRNDDGQGSEAKGPAQEKPAAVTGGERPKPAFELRVGRIKVTAWRNHSPAHGEWFSFTLTRSYKQGEQWKTAHSLGADDLLVAAMILTDARRRLAEETQKPRQAEERQPGAEGGNGQPQTGEDVPY